MRYLLDFCRDEKPKDFNKPVQYGWRFDPCEMGSHSAPRAPQFERGTTEDEFLRD